MWSYAYSLYLWPSFASALLVASLGWYGWRHRGLTGALPFALSCLFAAAWSLGAILETAAQDPSAEIFWLKFQAIWQLPMIVAATCFILQYAGLNRWLTTRRVALLSVPPLVFAILVSTNDLHHLAWTGFALVDGSVEPLRGPASSVGLGYSYLLSLFNVAVLVWLLLRSPRHRYPAALMIVGQLGARLVYELRIRGVFPSAWDADPFVLLAVFTLYAIALFRFHVFDPVPAARAVAIEQMREGMLVLDLAGRLVDANPAAERMLGASAVKLQGRPLVQLLPLPQPECGGPNGPPEWELALGGGRDARHYTVQAAPLKDGRGTQLGQLLLVHDVTERRRAQIRLLEQERVVATLQERERLARELHDGVGQVFAFVSLQAQTARKWLDDGDGQKARSLLGRLTVVAQQAQADMRESILSLKAGSSDNWSFLPALGRYLEDLRRHYGVQAELSVQGDVNEETLHADAAVQLLRVIQEALTNARRHAGPCTIRVSIGHDGRQCCVKVSDDGCGFDPAQLEPARDGHFGLAFMRERMGQIGGGVEIQSAPGAGTRVTFTAPVRATRIEMESEAGMLAEEPG